MQEIKVFPVTVALLKTLAELGESRLQPLHITHESFAEMTSLPVEMITKHAVRLATAAGVIDQGGSFRAKQTNAARLGQIVEVFEQWKLQTEQGDRVRLTPDRRKHINARLHEGYTVQELVEAVQGAVANPHRDDKGNPYLEVQSIFSTAARVDRYRSLVASSKPKEGAAAIEPDSVFAQAVREKGSRPARFKRRSQ